MPLNTTTTNPASSTLATTLNGSAGNDTLNGGAADDILNGLAGNDRLFGLAGNDVLDGGAGNDFLNGGLGDDSYLFGRGDGRDIVYMSDVRPQTEVNTLRLKAGVLPSDLAFDMSGTSLLINIIGSSDQFRVDGFLYGNSTTNSANPLQQIIFADGNTWNLPEIQARLYAGSAGADVRTGTYLADAISGLGGNDVLDGKGGDDTIDGGADADTITGGLGNDVLLGGSGHDRLSGNEGNDKLDGGAGDDRLDGGLDNDLLLGNSGNDDLYGGNGDDTLDGGTGNDALTGDFGKDVYLFGKGDGQDSIAAGRTLESGRLGTLQFKNGVLPGDLIVTPAPVGYGGVVFKLKDTSDQITIDGFLSNDDPASPYNPVQEVKFADGTSWNLAAMQAALYAGSKEADRLEGTVKGELISGQAGNDWIDAKGGNDTIDGGTGNDVINGGLGNDTYLFGKGDGQDEIRAVDDGAPGKLNTLQLKAGIAAGDVILSRYLSDLIVGIKGSTDKVTVSFFLNRDDIGNSFNPLQQIRFDDGTAWDAATILAKLNATSEADDTISGTSGADLIKGLGGADRLDGLGGNDTIDGGSGNDTLNGGAGDDTFLFGKGDGQDNITVYNGGGIDTLQFKPGVLPGEVLLEASPYSGLVVKIKGSADQLTVEQFMPNHDTSTDINALRQIRFSDGSAWDLARIDAELVTDSTPATPAAAFHGMAAPEADVGLVGVATPPLL